MKTINLDLGRGVGYGLAERAAKETAMRTGMEKSVVVAWYDRARNLASPAETCSKEGWKGARDYAEHHGANLRISVNKDNFEFFFAGVPRDITELDREDALEAHADASGNEFDDVQGG